MKLVCLFVLFGGAIFASVSVRLHLCKNQISNTLNRNGISKLKANEELGKAIAACRAQYPGSDERTISVTDYQSLPREDKCYLYCALSAQNVVISIFSKLFFFRILHSIDLFI